MSESKNAYKDQHKGRCRETVNCAEYVTGGLAQDAWENLEQHLLEGCVACASELERLRRVAAQLDLQIAVAEQPPPYVLERVLSEVASSVADDAPLDGGSVDVDDPGESDFSVSRVRQRDWQPTSAAGVDVSFLAMDEATRRVTSLIRMAAGSRFPSHMHRGREECYVIEGDLRAGSTVLRMGDYQIAGADSLHVEQSTRGGCMLLVTSSLDDEPL